MLPLPFPPGGCALSLRGQRLHEPGVELGILEVPGWRPPAQVQQRLVVGAEAPQHPAHRDLVTCDHVTS